jgi:diadenosine tetraphosphate (Ap4A) HIT family hydrolase
MASLRTPEGKARYQEYQKNKSATDSCPLCNRSEIKKFTYWNITIAEFPYDLIAKTHHLLIPSRHTSEKNLSEEELSELSLIKKTFVNDSYDLTLENTTKQLSIPGHFHIHLIEIKG